MQGLQIFDIFLSLSTKITELTAEKTGVGNWNNENNITNKIHRGKK
jgi:hypothetical protein